MPINSIHKVSTSRRNFIASSSQFLLGLGALLHCPALYAQVTAELLSATAEQQFHHIATFLSARPDLNVNLSNRAYQELQAHLPEFDIQLKRFINMLTDLDALEKTLEEIQICTAQAHKKQACQSPIRPETERMATFVQQVLQALYTGRIGQGANAKLITYEYALMFMPTKDITVIPSYARGARDYWVTPPLT